MSGNLSLVFLRKCLEDVHLGMLWLWLEYSVVDDKALLQFNEFLSKEKVTKNTKFSTFNRKTQRLDDF